MCGIYGELCLAASARPWAGGDTALDTLAHRGPDDRGSWLGERAFLGARRLSVVDPEGGAQPMWSPGGETCIVYNGELYNAAELRRELGGWEFRTRCDTEVVLAAHARWGAGCVKRFNGMFAFAIWDERTRGLVLARDRVGEKPLYVYRDAERWVFASEIKAIVANPAVPRRLSRRGLANYLAFGHAVAPETMFAGIEKVLPGHLLEVCDGRVRGERYWDVPEAPPGAATASFDEWSERVLELLDDSVRRRLVADVPVGAFLSGGVDSAAVTALMARHASGPVRTFTLGFEGGGAFSELAEARRVAERLGTDHHEVEVGAGAVEEVLPQLVHHYDEPFGDPAALPLHLLSRFARPHVTVALTGDGGDELFGGYRRYVADQVAPLYSRLPAAVTRAAVPALVERMPRLRRLKRAAATLPIRDAAARYPGWLRVFTPEMQRELLKPALAASAGEHDPSSGYAGLFEAAAGAGTGPRGDHLNRLMYADVKTWLPDTYLEKTDKATMASGLEARIPLIDHRLVELAFQVPARHKVRGLATKRVLKQALRGVVPDEVLRRRKHGFAVPIDRWLRGELRGLVQDVLTDERTRARDYFDPAAVDRLLTEHTTGRHARHDPLWLLLNFELWHREYLDVPHGDR
jgi:asparagine synthase (glutamine-hydrolysing)